MDGKVNNPFAWRKNKRLRILKSGYIDSYYAEIFSITIRGRNRYRAISKEANILVGIKRINSIREALY